MNRYQLERIYQAQSIEDYHLKSLDELRSVHGVVLSDIKGYKDLSSEQQSLFSKFIIHFFNSFGLDIRATLVPKAVYWAESVDLIFENEVVGTAVYAISENGKRRQIHRHNYRADNAANNAIQKSAPSYYLRFELKSCGRNEWYHVCSENRWY